MMGNYQVRFGGGRLEKEPYGHLVSRLPNNIEERRQFMETQYRNPGCQSTNHRACYGELWQCKRCGKTVCYAEGTDNDPDVCDDCWVAIHYPQYAEEQSRTTTLNAPEMQRVITQLLEQHGINPTDPMAFLWLALPEQVARLIIERINEHYLSVALAHPDGGGYFTLKPEVYFMTDTTGWKPIPFGQAKTPEALTRFAEAWAGRIEAEGWLTVAVALPEPAWQVDQDLPWCNTFDEGDDVCFALNKEQEEALCDLPF